MINKNCSNSTKLHYILRENSLFVNASSEKHILNLFVVDSVKCSSNDCQNRSKLLLFLILLPHRWDLGTLIGRGFLHPIFYV